MRAASLLAAALFLSSAASAETSFKPVPTQYIAALADPGAKSGTGAEMWGIWRLDPGPRGVRLGSYPNLKAHGGTAPAGWQFDPASWWLEENGLIMERPSFPCRPANIWSPATGRQERC